MISRSEVVAAARSWIDTPYHHQGRLKGIGVDCAGLVIGVARELGIVEPTFDINNYPRTPDGVSLIAWCDEYMQRTQEMQPGDVIVLKWQVDPQHMGILGDYKHGSLSIIHALAQPGSKRSRVVETRLGGAWDFVAAYQLPGVE